MEKSWSQLADRCSLFFDAPDGLYKELLKEAECELANKCNLLTMKYSYNLSASSNYTNALSSLKLPSNYKEMIAVWVNGDLIVMQDDRDWSFSQGSNGMVKDSGTPDAYTVYSGFISFDTMLKSTDVVDIKYKANLPNDTEIAKTVLMRVREGSSADYDRIFIDTTLGAELNGAYGYMPMSNTESATGVLALEDIQYQGPVGISVNPSMIGNLNDNTDPHPSLKNSDLRNLDEDLEGSICQEYKPGASGYRSFFHGGNSVDLTANEELNWTKGVILKYRNYAPVIENDYHLALCEYALYIASAKTKPDLSMKHQQIWEKRIRETLNDNLDKELSYRIKEEI